MKLRNYRNITEYNAFKPWCFPSVKEFSPRKQLAQQKQDTNLLNAEFKKKFVDRYYEKNASELIH